MLQGAHPLHNADSGRIFACNWLDVLARRRPDCRHGAGSRRVFIPRALERTSFRQSSGGSASRRRESVPGVQGREAPVATARMMTISLECKVSISNP